MRKEVLYMYSGRLDKEIEREFDIYKRDEFVEYLKNNDLSEYELELYVPRGFDCTIENFKRQNEDDEFFIFEEDKMVCLYLGE